MGLSLTVAQGHSLLLRWYHCRHVDLDILELW